MDMSKIKKTGSTGGESNKLGGGGRFKQMVAKTGSPALAAFIGRKMYGKKKMSKMAIKGKKAESENKKETIAEKGIEEPKK